MEQPREVMESLTLQIPKALDMVLDNLFELTLARLILEYTIPRGTLIVALYLYY